MTPSIFTQLERHLSTGTLFSLSPAKYRAVAMFFANESETEDTVPLSSVGSTKNDDK